MALAMEWPSAVDGVAVGFRASGAFFAFVHFWPNCCYNKPHIKPYSTSFAVIPHTDLLNDHLR